MIGTIAVIGFVIAILALAAFVLFALSPFAHHRESYRDAQGGLRESPHLETREEFERHARSG